MKIYVAGPYSSDPELNTNRSIFYGDWIRALGHTPFIPHLTHFWEQRHQHPYEFWLDYDMEWLLVCDAVFRFDGASSGADAEVEKAKELGMPVYYSTAEIP